MRKGIAADLHFGRGGNAGISLYKDSFHEMIDGMIEKKVDSAILAGDIFERFAWFNAITYMMVRDGLKKLITSGIKVYILSGNHDYDISGLFSAVVPFRDLGAVVITKPCVKDGILFVPWITKGLARDFGIDVKRGADDINRDMVEKMVMPEIEIARQSGCDLVVFHASVWGADYGERKCVESVDFTLSGKLFEGFKHVVGGHFHKRQKYEGIEYVGAMQRNTFGERDNKAGWLLIDGEDKEFVELEKTVKYLQYEWDLTGEGTLDKLYEYVEKKATEVDRAYVKFRYKARRGCGLDRARVMKAFYDGGALSVVPDPEYVDVEQARTEIRAEQDIVTQFREWKKVNEAKDEGGRIEKLLAVEIGEGFPVNVEEGYFEKIMVEGGSR